MVVSRDDLEASLAALRRDIDPRVGLFGPDSVSWLVDRELIAFLAGGRAALLQLAHPFVAAAVDQHSATRNDPLGRFQRTFEHVYAMVFGDWDTAARTARRVHAIHSRIVGQVPGGAFGERYAANDANALFWVQATLIDSAVLAFETIVRPLSAAERADYYAEARRFGALFGIPAACYPADWDAFVAYNRAMWPRLEVIEPAREMAGFLLAGPRLPRRLAAWYRHTTIAWLPEPVRRGYGYIHSDDAERRFERSLAAIRLAYRSLPNALRHVPAYRDALRRLEGKAGRDPIGKALDRLQARLLE